MVDQKALNDKVTKLSVSPPNETDKNRMLHLKQRKQYLAALDGMLVHHCQNAFFDIWFGHNPFGNMLAMPSDMMHLYKSGILKQVCQSFTNSMSTNVKVGVDNLMEDIFWSQWTTLSSSTSFLHTNFCGGATHLAMLSSHHWPGMAFSFLLMLLTPTGRDLCSDCFQKDDVYLQGYDWDEAPGMNLEHVYKLPILNDDDPEPTRADESDSDSVQSDSVQRDGHELDSKDDESESDDDSKPGTILNKQTKKGPVKLKCSRKQFVTLLENLLVFHTMYKCGPPLFGPESLPSDADKLLLVVHQLVSQIISYCPRENRHKWKLQKLHEVLNFPLMIFFFCHAENIDAGMGECHLKDVFKDVACNSQQRGQDTFLS
jgi:hypothetical protein